MHGELRYGPHKDVWVTTVDFGFGKVGARDWCAAMEKKFEHIFYRSGSSRKTKLKQKKTEHFKRYLWGHQVSDEK